MYYVKYVGEPYAAPGGSIQDIWIAQYNSTMPAFPVQVRVKLFPSNYERMRAAIEYAYARRS